MLVTVWLFHYILLKNFVTVTCPPECNDFRVSAVRKYRSSCWPVELLLIILLSDVISIDSSLQSLVLSLEPGLRKVLYTYSTVACHILDFCLDMIEMKCRVFSFDKRILIRERGFFFLVCDEDKIEK